MKDALNRAGKTLGRLYLLICALLWGIQGLLIFHPVTEDVIADPSTIHYEISIDQSKGIKSRGSILNPTLPGPVILFLPDEPKMLGAKLFCGV